MSELALWPKSLLAKGTQASTSHCKPRTRNLVLFQTLS